MSALRLLGRLLTPLTIAAALVPLSVTSAAAAAGDLDSTFGTGGTTVTPVAPGMGDDEARAVALQPDGKIVAAGFSLGTNPDFAVVRYTSTGALDPTFGMGGKVTTPIGAGDDRANAVAIQVDGKIVVAGYSHNGSNLDFALIRYTATGSLDSSFGSGGKVTTPIGSSQDIAWAVAIQPDGSIVAAGSGGGPGPATFAVARYTSSGALDSTFGSGGIVTTPIGSISEALTMAIQPDGKIVAAGYAFVSSFDFALARYTPDGLLDSTFGSGGVVTTTNGSNSDTARGLVLQPDGKIVVAGNSGAPGANDFALVRYGSDGTLDAGFGSGGKAITPIGSGNDIAFAAALQPDGKILAAGESFIGSTYEFALARFTSAGGLDPTYGSGGKVTTPIGPGDDIAYGVVIQPDGKAVVAGAAFPGSLTAFNADFAVARYQVDPPALSISDATLAESDSGTTNMTFTVSVVLAGVKAPGDVTVHYATMSDTATSADFVQKSGTLTFPVGQTSKTITVAVKGDLVAEPDETFFVNLSNPQGAVLDDGTAIGTILDNDPVPALYVSDTAVSEGNSGTVGATFILSLTNPSSEPILVDFTTADGTATSPSDYQARSGTKLFRPGQTTKTVTVFVNGETTQEPDETFSLRLFDPDGATISDGTGVGTITDDDRPTISISDVSKSEVDSGATTTYSFTVTLSKAGTNSITVQYATANGTAVAPGDYTAKSGTLTFSVGQTSKTISVTVKGDVAVEPDEVFYVNLSNPTNATIADGQGVGTIVNDD